MNQFIPNKIRIHLGRGVASALIVFAGILTVSGLMAQTQDNQTKEAPVGWPEMAPYYAAIRAFDAALTRAGWDLNFRQRLIKSPDSAKEAVAEEGNIKIPASKVIVFYETQPPKPDATKSVSADDSGYTAVHLLSESKSNENIHVFYLPPFKKDDRTKNYKYKDYFMCCYQYWRQ